MQKFKSFIVSSVKQTQQDLLGLQDKKRKENFLESRKKSFYCIIFAERYCRQSAAILLLVIFSVLIMVFSIIDVPNFYTLQSTKCQR